MALIFQPAGVWMNWMEHMPRAVNGTPLVVPDFAYELKRCATLPNTSVDSKSSVSLKHSHPAFHKPSVFSLIE